MRYFQLFGNSEQLTASKKAVRTTNINVKANKVYLPYFDKKQFIQIYYGGSSSGKSYFLASKVVLDVIKGANYLVCRNVAKTIRNSSFNEVTKAISYMGLKPYFAINKSDMAITCTLNGKQILFAGLDDAEKIKSVTPQNGVLHRIWIEEATEVKRSAYKQLTKRLRGNSDISKCVILSFNPILRSHWIYQEFFGVWQDDKTSYEDDNLSILKTTYKDNVFLTESDRQQLENETDPYYYQVYSLGNFGVLGNIIFKNWRVEDLSEQIPHFDNIFNGLDFGYANDPNALIKVHLDKKRKKIYVFDEWYQAGMSDDELVRLCKKMIGRQYITCDSAEPKTIDYLCANDINAVATVKGADSINRGIRWLQGYEIIVDVKCQNFKNEIEQYHWQEDSNGNVMARPVDANNHLLDALRYALCDEILAADVQAGRRI
ncbi:MAG: PBSX family phage terminase large subunit [Acutalibacteraceae bacterium]